MSVVNSGSQRVAKHEGLEGLLNQTSSMKVKLKDSEAGGFTAFMGLSFLQLVCLKQVWLIFGCQTVVTLHISHHVVVSVVGWLFWLAPTGSPWLLCSWSPWVGCSRSAGPDAGDGSSGVRAAALWRTGEAHDTHFYRPHYGAPNGV